MKVINDWARKKKDYHQSSIIMLHAIISLTPSRYPIHKRRLGLSNDFPSDYDIRPSSTRNLRYKFSQ